MSKWWEPLECELEPKMTTPETIAKILANGGRALIVGGEMKDLPRVYHDHPQLLVWDDNQQNLLGRMIPSNVKVIIYNRWVSHATAKLLSDAAKSLHALKFPMLRSREVKELLSCVVPPTSDVVIEEPPTTIPLDQTSQIDPETTDMKATHQKLGSIKDFVIKNIDPNVDYSIKGKFTEEGVRIFDLMKKEGMKSTLASTIQTVRAVVHQASNNGAKRASKKASKIELQPVPVKAVVNHGNDDFTELERLIEDAITAMRLVQEHLPKVRSETEKLRGMKERVMKLFE